jgi:hypothetical protein
MQTKQKPGWIIDGIYLTSQPALMLENGTSVLYVPTIEEKSHSEIIFTCKYLLFKYRSRTYILKWFSLQWAHFPEVFQILMQKNIRNVSFRYSLWTMFGKQTVDGSEVICYEFLYDEQYCFPLKYFIICYILIYLIGSCILHLPTTSTYNFFRGL